MAVIRAQVTFESNTGMARDRAVNTFHFNGLINPINLAGIRDQLIAFYNNVPAGNTQAVGGFISSRQPNFTVKLYDVTNGPAGVPILVSAVTPKVGSIDVSDLPSEVALCLSFEGTPEAGLIQTRRRGRIYIGRLNIGARQASAGATHLVSPTFAGTLRAAGAALALNVDTFAEWVVYSRPYAGRAEVVRPGKSTLPAIAARPGTTVNIDRVWTDDAFDTQRRRGERATAKTFLTTGE